MEPDKKIVLVNLPDNASDEEIVRAIESTQAFQSLSNGEIFKVRWTPVRESLVIKAQDRAHLDGIVVLH